MANLRVSEHSAEGKRTAGGDESWFSWMMGRMGLKSDGRPEDNDVGSTEDTTRAEGRSEKPTEKRQNGWSKGQKVIGEHENGTEEFQYRSVNFTRAAGSCDGTTYAFESEINTPAFDPWSMQYDRINSDSISAQRSQNNRRSGTLESNPSNCLTSQDIYASAERRKSAKDSKEDNFKAFEPMEEDNSKLLAQQLTILRDELNVMKRKIEKIDDNHSAMALQQNIKRNPLIENVLKSSTKGNYTMNEIINERIDKLERIVSTLSTEKESLIKVNRNMAQEIKTLKSKQAFIEQNSHKHCVRKTDYDSFKIEINSYVSQMNYSKKDLDHVHSTLRTIEENISNCKENMKIENTRKYDKLKMRLCIIENKTNEASKAEKMLQQIMTTLSSACHCGGANQPMGNVHNYYSQQPYSATYPRPPVVSSVPSSPPAAPPAAPPAPPEPTFKPPRSQVAPPDPPGQYPRYTINDELLRDMASQLRKHDINNIRKIPRRADMRRSGTATNSADLAGPSSQQELPLPLTVPVAPEVSSDSMLPLVDLDTLEVHTDPPLPIIEPVLVEVTPPSQLSSVDSECIEVQTDSPLPIIEPVLVEAHPPSQLSLKDSESIKVQEELSLSIIYPTSTEPSPASSLINPVSTESPQASSAPPTPPSS